MVLCIPGFLGPKPRQLKTTGNGSVTLELSHNKLTHKNVIPQEALMTIVGRPEARIPKYTNSQATTKISGLLVLRIPLRIPGPTLWSKYYINDSHKSEAKGQNMHVRTWDYVPHVPRQHDHMVSIQREMTNPPKRQPTSCKKWGSYSSGNGYF